MDNYSTEEANRITQILRELAILKENHPNTLNIWIDSATDDLVSAREFIIGMLNMTS